MFFGRIRRLETECAGNLSAGRRHTVFGNGVLNEPEDLSLTRSKVRHASPVYVTITVIIYSLDALASTFILSSHRRAATSAAKLAGQAEALKMVLVGGLTSTRHTSASRVLILDNHDDFGATPNATSST
jgi:hypothetical protein